MVEKTPVKRVESLVKGLAVICAFNRDRPKMTLSQVAKIVSLPRATARRLLHTLVELGYVETDGKLFHLSPRLLEVGYSYLGSLPWWEIALPHIQGVTDALDETCVASVLAGEEIVMIARRNGTRLMAINVPMGTRLPAHATAMGRILIANKNESEIDRYVATATLRPLTPHTVVDKTQLRKTIEFARTNDYSIVDQELELGLLTLAVPIRDMQGNVLAAMAVSVHSSRATAKLLQQNHLPVLRQAAKNISAVLPSNFV
jgi:IclR family transcriptional regulator, pca regulon regulatory protein